jgi:hypothetical protein
MDKHMCEYVEVIVGGNNGKPMACSKKATRFFNVTKQSKGGNLEILARKCYCDHHSELMTNRRSVATEYSFVHNEISEEEFETDFVLRS